MASYCKLKRDKQRQQQHASNNHKLCRLGTSQQASGDRCACSDPSSEPQDHQCRPLARLLHPTTERADIRINNKMLPKRIIGQATTSTSCPDSCDQRRDVERYSGALDCGTMINPIRHRVECAITQQPKSIPKPHSKSQSYPSSPLASLMANTATTNDNHRSPRPKCSLGLANNNRTAKVYGVLSALLLCLLCILMPSSPPPPGEPQSRHVFEAPVIDKSLSESLSSQWRQQGDMLNFAPYHERQQQQRRQVPQEPEETQIMATETARASTNYGNPIEQPTPWRYSGGAIMTEPLCYKLGELLTLATNYVQALAARFNGIMAASGISSESLLQRKQFERFAGKIITTGSSGGVLLASAQQYKPEWPSKSLQQEIFLLNLEDGYFGCQVNESQDFLQLFELSRLCDGQAQCYLGTDELAAPLKCNNRERCGSYPASGSGGSRNSNSLMSSPANQDYIQCVNGVCLDGLCYCNDGFGGKACDVPDENECKFRPCDVFAHCTNTMGSYYCSCFPGKCTVEQYKQTDRLHLDEQQMMWTEHAITRT